MVGTPIDWRHVSDKQTVQRKRNPHLFLNRKRWCQNYIILTYCHPGFPFSSYSLKHKYQYNEIHSNPVKDIGLCEISSKAINIVWYQNIPHGSPRNYELHWNKLAIKQHKIFSNFRYFKNMIT